MKLFRCVVIVMTQISLNEISMHPGLFIYAPKSTYLERKKESSKHRSKENAALVRIIHRICDERMSQTILPFLRHGRTNCVTDVYIYETNVTELQLN